MDWRQFVMDLEKLNPDSVEAVFVRHGAGSITLTDAGNDPVLEPVPGDAPLWTDTQICALFSPEANLDRLQDDLRTSLGIDTLPAHRIENLEDRDWEREWLKDFAPMKFGKRLWICPGDSTVSDDDTVIVRLDPGLAFGTGTHATTALCLEWLDGQDLEDRTILDYGCGSGVLAIAALKLGCRFAVATDIDHQAIAATETNAGRNEVAARMSTTQDAIDGRFHIVVANILAAPLVDLAARIATHVESGCLLALSGILSKQVDDVLTAYEPWIAFDDPRYREQGGQTWALLTGQRIGG